MESLTHYMTLYQKKTTVPLRRPKLLVTIDSTKSKSRHSIRVPSKGSAASDLVDVPQAVTLTHWQSLKGFHLPSNVKVRERISKYF